MDTPFDDDLAESSMTILRDGPRYQASLSFLGTGGNKIGLQKCQTTSKYDFCNQAKTK